MPLIPLLAGPIIAALIATVALPAQAGEFNACKTKVDRAAQMQAPDAADDAELLRCRQIIKEWTLRDSRISVDESALLLSEQSDLPFSRGGQHRTYCAHCAYGSALGCSTTR
jgi:hypothetical protein